jgi:hypothetical protein
MVADETVEMSALQQADEGDRSEEAEGKARSQEARNAAFQRNAHGASASAA